MKITDVKSLEIPGVVVIQYERFSDKRGYFSETYRFSDLKQYHGLSSVLGTGVFQANESYSRRTTLRGLHFQWNPNMGKLVRTISGHMLDIVLDIRLDSPTLGKAIIYDMPVSNSKNISEWIWVPPGCAHGNFFLDDSHIEYFCSAEYNADCESSINPFSEDIDWSLCDKRLHNLFKDLAPNFIVSQKDMAGLRLKQWLKSDTASNFKMST